MKGVEKATQTIFRAFQSHRVRDGGVGRDCDAVGEVPVGVGKVRNNADLCRMPSLFRCPALFFEKYSLSFPRAAPPLCQFLPEAQKELVAAHARSTLHGPTKDLCAKKGTRKMKRIGIAAGLLAALLLTGGRSTQAQYAFIGERSAGTVSDPLLVIEDQTTGAFVDYQRPAALAYSLFDLKVGPDGNLYGMQTNANLVVFNGSSGAYIRTVTLPFVPSAIAFGMDGNLYAAHSQFGIYKFQGPSGPNGGNLGQSLGLFAPVATYITSLSFHSGAGGASCELLACVGGTITRFSTSGTVLGTVPFSQALNVLSVGPNGDFYAPIIVNDPLIANRTNNYIQRFSGTTYQPLNYLTGNGKFNSSALGGHLTGQFFYLAWGPDNCLYLTDDKGDGKGTDLIHKVTPALDANGRPDYTHVGTVSTFNSGLNHPTSIAFLQQPLGSAYPQIYANQLPFRETGGSVWGPGQSTYTASYFLGPTWDTGGTATLGGFDDVFLLGTFGAQLSASTKGKAGLNFSATASAGRVNINYPVQVSMDFGDRNYLFAGDWTTVLTSYQVSGAANLGTQASTFSASLDAVLNGYFKGEGKAEAFSRTLIDTTITPPAGSDISGNGFFNYGFNILSTDSILGGSDKKNYTLPGGFLSGYVKKPVVTAAGMPNPLAADPRIITATGQDTFFNIRGSVSDLARKVVQDTTGLYIPIGSDSISEHFLGSGFDLGYSFLDLYANVNINVKQDFTFAPVPHVKLQLPAGQTVNWKDKNGTEHDGAGSIEFDAGDTIRVQIPSNPILQFTPTYTLPNTFTHSVSLVLNPSLDLTPLKLTASGSVAGVSLGSLNWQPIDTQTLASTSLAIPITTRTFALPGFQTLTQTPITVSGRLHPAPALSGAMPSQLPITILPFNYSSTLLPSNIVSGTTSVTIKGMTFPTTGAKAYFTIHGSTPVALTTVYNDPCTLTALLPNKYLLIAGTGQIYVTIPNANGSSNSIDIAVVNPIPHIDNTGPNVYAADPNLGGNLLLTVTDHSTTFLWSADYYNIVQSKWFASFGSSLASVFPGYDFAAVTPMPAIHFKGSDGADKTLALYQESNPSGLLWAVLPLDYYARPDTAQITVINPGPGGGTSNALPLTVGVAIPQITSIAPSAVLPGSATFRLEVTGPLSQNTPPNPGPYGNFNGASTICFDGQPLPTTFVSAGDLRADIPASFVTSAGTHTIKVTTTVNNGAGGTASTLTSNLVSLSVRSFSPTIAAVRNATIALYPGAIVSADRAFVGAPNAPQYNLTVNGQNFDPASVVQWNGAALTTRYVNDTQLTAAVPYASVLQPGTATITIANSTAAGGGGLSNPASVTITNAKPNDTALAPLTASSLTPGGVKNGGTSAAVTVQGEGFYPGSVVNVNGAARPTVFVSHNALTVTLNTADLASVRTLALTVTNPAPGGGTTAPLSLGVGSLVSGTLTFDSLAPTAPAQNVTFTCRPTDGTAPTTFTALVPGSGAFTLGGLLKKSYTVHVKSDRFLAVNFAVNLAGGDATGLTAFLPGGDANGDNAVDIGDFGLLVNAYNGAANLPGSGYDVRADFTGDGTVDIADFGVLVNNYNTSGSP